MNYLNYPKLSSQKSMVIGSTSMYVEKSDFSCMLTSPLVSVVVITFNHGEFIQEAVESIAKQQCTFPFEIIIGDDFSNDDTRHLALTLQARFSSLIRVIMYKKNVGMNINFATLIGLARGKFLAFCEGDDYWQVSNKLQRHADLLQACPDVSLVFSDYGRTFFSEKKWHWVERTVPDYVNANTQLSLFSLLKEMHIHLSAMMAPSALIREYLVSVYHNQQRSLGDVPLFLYLASQGNVRYLDGSVSTYRQHSASATNRSKAGFLKIVMDHAAVVDFFSSRFVNANQYREIRLAMRRRIANAAYVAGSKRDYLNNMDLASPKAWLRLSLMLVPILHERKLTRERERQRKSLMALGQTQ